MHAEASKLYGLIRLHKEDKTARPVVSYSLAPSFRICKFVDKKMKELPNFKANCFVENSIDLIRRLENLNQDLTSFEFVWFDVTNMFHNIHVGVNCF